jgi:hypothetical protein
LRALLSLGFEPVFFLFLRQVNKTGGTGGMCSHTSGEQEVFKIARHLGTIESLLFLTNDLFNMKQSVGK